jgi:transposase
MEVVYERCCGMDIHKAKIVACCLDEKNQQELRTFGTMTGDLIELCEWLLERKIQMVAMESTGSYWKPVYNILEVMNVRAMLVNAQHIKAVPGRKTDVCDAQWIASLLRHGLLKASFVRSREDRELKELIRYRISLIEERAREYNRLDKVLQGANIKLSSVASHLSTKSGMEMIRAIAKGETNEQVLASLAVGTMKKKRPELEKALQGLIQPHQQKMLQMMLGHIEYLSQQIDELDAEVEARQQDNTALIEALDAIPGVGKQSAEVILAEIGTDMSQFKSAKHLSSWAGVSPGQNESAGKRKRSRTRNGNPTLKKTLVQCARAAGNTKTTYLSALHQRIASRRGAKIATVAVARAILEICYFMIRDGSTYHDLGADYFTERDHQGILRRNKKRIEALGYKVTVEKITA